ncbi:hypothetical protein BX666DRAFT_2028239 [Dichotomocladium elegans]|nr:hypothetical protein BX666DRAFT_2028239 [Dichotomocladium elegans]
MGEPPPLPPKESLHVNPNRLQFSSSQTLGYPSPRSRDPSGSKLQSQPSMSDAFDIACSVASMTIDMTPVEPHAPSDALRKKSSSGNGLRGLGRFLKGWGKNYDRLSYPPPAPTPRTTAVTGSATQLQTAGRSPTVSTTTSCEDGALDAMSVVINELSNLSDVAPNNETKPDIPNGADNDESMNKHSLTTDPSPEQENSKEIEMEKAEISSKVALLPRLTRYPDDEDARITEDQSDRTDMTSESDSVAISTPPAPSVTESDKMDSDCNYIASDTARRIWEQDPTVYDDFEHIAEWIGDGKPMSMCILRHYFLFFDFTNVRLDEAFRTLCGKLHLKAETQQIDRVLEQFAKRYWDCNPFGVYGNPDVIHAVVYSLMLLNTDLHVAQGDHKKMSRSAFVRNTINAISLLCHQPLVARGNDSTISEVNESLASSVIFDHGDHELKRSHSYKSSSSTSGSSINRLYPYEVPSITPVSLSFGSKGWYAEIEAILREMYISIRNHEILDSSLAHTVSSGQRGNNPHDARNNRHLRRRSLHGPSGTRVGDVFKRSFGTIMLKAGRESVVLNGEHIEDHPWLPGSISQRQRSTSMQSCFSQGSSRLSHTTSNYQEVVSLLHHSELPSSYTSTAPYYKEGLVVRKHLLERTGSKSRNREWKECFLVVDRGEIRMYTLDSSSFHHVGPCQQQRQKKMGIRSSMMMTRAQQDTSTPSFETAAIGGGDWLNNAEPLGIIDLKHTLSNALPSGYSPQRPYAFTLQQSNGGVYVFQAGSAEQVIEWVSTCNYWAARESKEPLTGSVSSMEYGWGACLEDDMAAALKPSVPDVYEWVPPAPPFSASSLGEKAQLEALGRHIRNINDDLDAHHEIKEKMEQRFSSCMRSSQAMRAWTNWENKSQYLLREIIKYQNYYNSIEQSLALQDEAIQKMND